MGKEQDLLEAARNGNVEIIEKLFGQKSAWSKKLPALPSGLSSLRRPLNANCQDASGETPLHYASIHGHKDAVRALLRHDACANIRDNKGCYPLHWAAWSGHAEVCDILLTQGPSVARVDEQNLEGETALHIAAQYGLGEVVAVLLDHHADVRIRNCKSLGEFSALDLASQYGRIDTVHLLVRKAPPLLKEKHENHSPLHLAAKHGHKQVVDILINAGYSVNTLTTQGTGLHEASVNGKADVVKALLRAGVDVKLVDCEGKTVLQKLAETHSQITKVIQTIIEDYLHGKTLGKTLAQEHPLYDVLPAPQPVRDQGATSTDLYAVVNKHTDRPVSESNSADTDPGVFLKTEDMDDESPYDTPNSMMLPVANRTDTLENNRSPVAKPSPPRMRPIGHKDGVPKKPPRKRTGGSNSKTSEGSTGGDDVSQSDSVGSLCNDTVNNNSLDNAKQTLTAVVFTDNNSASTELGGQNNGNHTSLSCDTSVGNVQYTDNNIPVVSGSNSRGGGSLGSLSADGQVSQLMESCNNSGTPEGQDDGCRGRDAPQRKSTSKQVLHAAVITEFELDTTSSNDIEEGHTQHERLSSYRQSSNENLSDTNCLGADDKQSIQTADGCQELLQENLEDVVNRNSGGSGSTPGSRPPSLDFSSKRSSVCSEVPLSPTGYEQPPTPDHPPPSPMTAILGIGEKINPKEKRRSRDMETITEQEFLAVMNPPKAAVAAKEKKPLPVQSVSVGLGDDKQTETDPAAGTDRDLLDSVELMSKAENSPFVGLTKGSRPTGQRRVKSQIYENVSRHRQKRYSAPGVFMNFDPVEERKKKKVPTATLR